MEETRQKTIIHFKNAYERYLMQRYMIDSTDSNKIESPREFVIALLQYMPYVVSNSIGSAQYFKRLLLRSALHEDGDGRVFGYDADTLRRAYDFLKKEGFERLLFVHPRWQYYLDNKEIVGGYYE